MRRMVSGIVLALLLMSMLTLAFNIQPVKASETIYIRANGLVEGTEKIITADNITYTFTDNINEPIVIERNNILINGAGYTLQGVGNGTGISLSERINVTIKNTKIKNFMNGIQLDSSSGNSISGNNITANNWIGIYFITSCNNSISGNNVTANWYSGICLSSSSNNTINGNSVEHYGIILSYSSNNNISRNHIRASDNGIALAYSSNNTINGNYVTSNTISGITVDFFSSSNNISENSVTDNKDGIYVLGSSNYNSLSGNNITNSGEGITLLTSDYSTVSGNLFQNDGLYVLSLHNVVESNFVNGKPLYYLEGVSGKTVSSDAGQVVLVNCSSIVVNNLSLSNTTVGVELLLTRSTVIANNNITNNLYGIMLDSSDNNSISEDNITHNIMVGIYLESSSNNNISRNNITENDDGAWLFYSFYNQFFHNNFDNNFHYQVIIYTKSANTWDNGYPSGGNYWSDYQTRYPSAHEIDSSSIWSTPYSIDVHNIDQYPLMKPYSAPRPSYMLTITATVGGTTNPAAGTYSYTDYSQILVTAIPNANYLLDHWELDIINIGSANPYTVLMNSNHTLNTVFSHAKPAVPVGGYSFPLETNVKPEPSAVYLSFILISAIIFTAIKRKVSRSTQSSSNNARL
jgi:parallel beta-helix repeat protein